MGWANGEEHGKLDIKMLNYQKMKKKFFNQQIL